MTTLNLPRIAELLALSDQATKGPWFTADWNDDFGDNKTTVETRVPEIVHPGRSSLWPGHVQKSTIAETEYGVNPIADAAFIACAPELAEHLRLAVAEVAKWQARMTEIHALCKAKGRPSHGPEGDYTCIIDHLSPEIPHAF